MNKNAKTARKYSNRKNTKFPRTKQTETESNAVEKDAHFNDLSWYVVDEQILNDAARIPYSIPTGMPYTRRATFSHAGLTEPSYDDALPGILVSHVMPILGYAKTASDAVNVAANSIYQYVRSRISGSRPYDAVDFMIYLGAMDSVFCFTTWLTRLYATMFTYHQANRYLSRALVESQGFDFDDIMANLSQFRAGINTRIAKIKSLYIPSILPVFKRHSWMFSNYYIEGPSEKDQIYMHSLEGVYRFKLDDEGAGMLDPYNIHTNGALTVSDLFTILDTLIDPIYDDEDFNRISGDLLKAYEGNVFTLTEIPDIATVNLVFNEEVLLQFKNAKYKYVRPQSDRWLAGAFTYNQSANKRYLIFSMPDAALNNVTEIDYVNNANYVVTSSTAASGIRELASMWQDWSKPALLTSPHPNVLPGENMINTRLTLDFAFNNSNPDFWSSSISGIAVGTEWPLFFTIHTYHRNKNTNATTLFFRMYEHNMSLDYTSVQTVQQYADSQVPILSSFKYLPEIFITIHNNSDTTYNAGRSMFEVDNYALVDFNVLDGLHNAAILGEYNVPKLSVGK